MQTSQWRVSKNCSDVFLLSIQVISQIKIQYSKPFCRVFTIWGWRLPDLIYTRSGIIQTEPLTKKSFAEIWNFILFHSKATHRWSYTNGHFMLNLVNEPSASFVNFIWNDQECKILFIIWPFKWDFIALKWTLFQQENALLTCMLSMAWRLRTKVWVHVSSYEFYDTMLSTDSNMTLTFFPIERVESGAVWKFMINHVTNARRAHFVPWWRQM